MAQNRTGGKPRNEGIELLRIILGLMVCTLHVINHGRAWHSCAPGSPLRTACELLFLLSFGAVNCFGFISGYTATPGRRRSYGHLVELWLQAFFYLFALSALLWLLGLRGGKSGSELLPCLLPVSSGKAWYFTAYFFIFLVSPAVDAFVFSLREDTARKALLVLLLLTLIPSCFGDPFVFSNGYSTLWLLCLYAAGALSRQGHLLEKRSLGFLAAAWLLCLGLTYLVTLRTGQVFTYTTTGIVLASMILVLIFARLPIRHGKRLIAVIAPSVLGIYLLQANPIIWDGYMSEAFRFVGQYSLFPGILLVAGGALLIFLIGLAVELLRRQLFRLFRVPALSQAIAGCISRALNVLARLL